MFRPRSNNQDHSIRLDNLLDDLRRLLQQRYRCGFHIDDMQTRTVAVDVGRERGGEARCGVAEFGAGGEESREEGFRGLFAGGLTCGV